jgi:S-adenosylmethionine:tRNA ribosyltransferase-isomerase
MIAAERFDRRGGKLLVVKSDGSVRRLQRSELANLFAPGDLVVANDAATLPTSLQGTHRATGAPIEMRLAAWIALGDVTRFVALAFGAGDHRTRTEERLLPPPLSAGDRLALGPLSAAVERVLDHPRLVLLRLLGGRDAVLAGLARHGRPIQYAHVAAPLALWDVWTPIAAAPIAFEPPSAGFALDWATLAAWRGRGIGFATVSHAAGISSTGDGGLDARLPFDEPYRIPQRTAAAVARAKTAGRRIIAIGTTVVRALEAAADPSGAVRAGESVACGRITRGTRLRVVDAILTGAHQPGESHFELLRALADDPALERMSAAFIAGDFRTHEFGDSALVERARTFGDGNQTVSASVGGASQAANRQPNQVHAALIRIGSVHPLRP